MPATRGRRAMRYGMDQKALPIRLTATSISRTPRIMSSAEFRCMTGVSTRSRGRDNAATGRMAIPWDVPWPGLTASLCMTAFSTSEIQRTTASARWKSEQGLLERLFAPVVAGFGIAADKNIFACAGGFRTTHFLGGAPNHLRIVADIFHAAGFAVVGKGARPEEFLFPNPGLHHGFWRKIAFRAGPEIFPFRSAAIFRRMLEPAGRRQIVSPTPCRLGQC